MIHGKLTGGQLISRLIFGEKRDTIIWILAKISANHQSIVAHLEWFETILKENEKQFDDFV